MLHAYLQYHSSRWYPPTKQYPPSLEIEKTRIRKIVEGKYHGCGEKGNTAKRCEIETWITKVFLRLILHGHSHPVQCTIGGHEPCQHKVALQVSVTGSTEHAGLEGRVTVRHVFTGGMQKMNSSSNSPSWEWDISAHNNHYALALWEWWHLHASMMDSCTLVLSSLPSPTFACLWKELLRVAWDISIQSLCHFVWKRFTELQIFLKFCDDSWHLPFITVATVYFFQSCAVYMLIGTTCHWLGMSCSAGYFCNPSICIAGIVSCLCAFTSFMCISQLAARLCASLGNAWVHHLCLLCF